MIEFAEYVVSELNFLDPGVEKPQTFIYPPTSGKDPMRPKLDPHEVRIYDARDIADTLSLDKQGFELMRHQSRVENFYDDGQVEAVYYAETEALVKQVMGATRVHMFDHTVRNNALADDSDNLIRRPVGQVHNDYTDKSGPQRVRDLLGDEAEELLQHRFAFINVWRPIKGPVLDQPLALCDAGSMAPDDLVETDLVYEDRVGNIHGVRFNPDQRWYYVREMQPDEVMFLKCFDSETDGRARFMAHTGFANPESPPDAPPRESIEARTIAFFAPQDS
ncbi:MAG: CmcJ/NvfI family oxidoreductase [Alphaproteobacteria bacterium]|jgi:hypothetical protein|nr:CmcJ/NvfI family oxidoreductase [Alphaproteobacteria bacterium]